jgi:hypothetical protein
MDAPSTASVCQSGGVDNTTCGRRPCQRLARSAAISALPRQTPNVGAVCLVWRRQLCGADLGDRPPWRLSHFPTPHNKTATACEGSPSARAEFANARASLVLDGGGDQLFVTLLCGVGKWLNRSRRRSWMSAPHNYRRHITHQMWCTTFDAGKPHVRICAGVVSRRRASAMLYERWR